MAVTSNICLIMSYQPLPNKLPRNHPLQDRSVILVFRYQTTVVVELLTTGYAVGMAEFVSEEQEVAVFRGVLRTWSEFDDSIHLVSGNDFSFAFCFVPIHAVVVILCCLGSLVSHDYRRK